MDKNVLKLRALWCLSAIASLSCLGYHTPFKGQDASFDSNKACNEALAFLKEVRKIKDDEDLERANDYIVNNKEKIKLGHVLNSKSPTFELALYGILFRYDQNQSSLAYFYRPWSELGSSNDPLMSVSECDNLARKYASIGAKPESHVSLLSEVQVTKSDRPVVDYLFCYKIGRFRNSIPRCITFSRVDGKLLVFDAFEQSDNEALSNVKLVDKRICEMAAMDAYQRYKPYLSARLLSSDLCIGPIPGISVFPNELTAEIKRCIDQRIGVPQYQFWIGDADSAYELKEEGLKSYTAYARNQIIYVDAVTGKGTLIEYRETGYRGAQATKNDLASIDLKKELMLSGTRCRGLLRLVKGHRVKKDKPEGKPILLIQTGLIHHCVFEMSVKRLWVNTKNGWQAYSTSDKFLGEIEKQATQAKTTYGSVK